MLNNTQFSMAVHVMAALAFNEGTTLPSAALAKTVGTNPSFLRQLIGKLAQANLVSTKLGKGGGTTIARSPDSITLLDIYQATTDPDMIAKHTCSKGACAVANAIPSILDDLDAQLQRVVETELERTKLSTLVARYVDA